MDRTVRNALLRAKADIVADCGWCTYDTFTALLDLTVSSSDFLAFMDEQAATVKIPGITPVAYVFNPDVTVRKIKDTLKTKEQNHQL